LHSELIDEARYLANRNDLLKLLNRVYGENGVSEIIDKYELILVGGQALALWHYQYFSLNSAKDTHYSFSDDIDFYGLKVALQFVTEKLHVDIKTPDDFDPTVNLGVFTIPSKSNDDGFIVVDIIHSVGGLERKEILNGVDIVRINEIELPIINPILCLKSRLHNFFAPYKTDKEKELYRVDIALRCSKAYLNEELGAGWSKETSKLIETIIEIARSPSGCDLYVKHSIDILEAIDINHKNLNEKFLNNRYPKAIAEIDSLRSKRSRHLERFNSFDPKSEKELSIETVSKKFNDFSSQIKPLDSISLKKFISNVDSSKKTNSALIDKEP